MIRRRFILLSVLWLLAGAGTAKMNASPLHYVPITPCRVVNTLNAPGPLGGPYLSALIARTFNLPSGNCDLPTTAAAYAINITAIPHTTLGYLTVWPTGQPQPVTSVINSLSGVVKSVFKLFRLVPVAR
jgi:hypothetical protein